MIILKTRFGVVMPVIHDLMSSNVGRARNKKLFVVSACIVKDHPELVKELVSDEDHVVSACPEEHHINMIGYKIASFIAYSGIKEVKVLTVDGSLHCIQLHYILENIRKRFFNDLNVQYFVLVNGRVFEISEETVKVSRHFYKLQKSLSTKEV